MGRHDRPLNKGRQGKTGKGVKEKAGEKEANKILLFHKEKGK